MMQEMLAASGGGGGNGAYGYKASASSLADRTISLGFKPKSLIVTLMYNGTEFTSIYDEDSSSNSFIRRTQGSDFTTSLPNTNGVGLQEITSDGFIIYAASGTVTAIYWVAF